MKKYELLIAVKDEEDLISGYKRKKAGDVITIVEAPHIWGKKETDQYLVVPIKSLKNLEELRIKLCARSTEEEQLLIGKNKYKIDLDDLKSKLPELDLNKVADKTKHYQPFKSISQMSTSIPIEDIDCGQYPNNNFYIKWTGSDLILNKENNKYINPVLLEE